MKTLTSLNATLHFTIQWSLVWFTEDNIFLKIKSTTDIQKRNVIMKDDGCVTVRNADINELRSKA